LKIGIVLTNPPKYSETFLNTFITIVSKEHEVVLFSNSKSKKFGRIEQKHYIRWNNFLIGAVENLFNFLLAMNRFQKLKKLTPLKLLVADIPIWSYKDLDVLHFAFGNLAVQRENYAEVMGCKMSVSFRGSDINIFPIWHKFNYHDILEKCDRIHCNSQLLKNNILKYDNNVISKIKVINPGIQNEFLLSEDEANKLSDKRNNLSITQIISIGRLHWVKGYEIVLEALAELKKVNNNFKYLIIGTGLEEEKLVYLTSFYGLEDNVIFLGSLGSEEIRWYLESSHLFIQTSWAEGFSNSTMEAQALGLPVIVTPVSGMDELVIHEKTGYITENHRSDEIVTGIQWFLNLSNKQKMDVAIMASKKVQQNFSLAKLQTNWLEYFN
jgi:colanic acid/amylovoran biosynthesis glycosyltransferase